MEYLILYYIINTECRLSIISWDILSTVVNISFWELNTVQAITYTVRTCWIWLQSLHANGFWFQYQIIVHLSGRPAIQPVVTFDVIVMSRDSRCMKWRINDNLFVITVCAIDVDVILRTKFNFDFIFSRKGPQHLITLWHVQVTWTF